MSEIKPATAKKIKALHHMEIMKIGGQALGEDRMKAFRAEPSAATIAPILGTYINSFAALTGLEPKELAKLAVDFKPAKAGKKASAKKAEEAAPKKASKPAKEEKKAAKPAKKSSKEEAPVKKKKK